MKITDKRVDTKYPLFKQDLKPGMVVECESGHLWLCAEQYTKCPHLINLVDSYDYEHSIISQGKSFREVDAELVIREKS